MARRDLSGAVDFAYLEDYAGGDQQVVDEVLSLFQEQAVLWRRLLEPDAADGIWRDAVHTLKGSARGIGAGALAESCVAAESASGTQRATAVDGVRYALDQTLADIAAYAHEQALQSLKTPKT